MFVITLFGLFVLVISASFHEVAHGWVAYKLGDNTAKDAGRLTLNPIAHLDPFGSVLLPLMLVMSGTPFLIASAKPVPVNPYNLSDKRYGGLKVSLAGPMSNLLLAIIFGLVARFVPLTVFVKTSLVISYFKGDFEQLFGLMQGSFVASIFVMSIVFCVINLILMIFNLVPIPPLDGSKILMPFLSADWQIRMHKIEPYGFFIIIGLLAIGAFSFISPLLLSLFSLITGLS